MHCHRKMSDVVRGCLRLAPATPFAAAVRVLFTARQGQKWSDFDTCSCRMPLTRTQNNISPPPSPSPPDQSYGTPTHAMTSTIPTPPSIPFLGHVTAIDSEVPLRSFQLLAEQYGEIFQLNIIGALLVQSRLRKRILKVAY